MILPIVAYGDPVLRKEAQEITAEYPDLKETIDNMWETMYNAAGVGLKDDGRSNLIDKRLITTLFLVETTINHGLESHL